MKKALVAYELTGSVASIVMTSPRRGNVLNIESADQFLTALHHVVEDRARVVVLRAEGWAFCVGGDICAFAESTDPAEYVGRLAGRLHRIIRTLRELDAITVSVVNGPAAGAGFPLALAADLVVATDRASFTLGYTKLGLTLDAGASLLVHSLGLKRAMRLALLNDTLGARDAQALRLVTHLVSDALADVDALTTRLASGASSAFAKTRRLLHQAQADGDIQSALDREQRAVAEAAASADGREGVQAFLSKRPARFL